MYAEGPKFVRGTSEGMYAKGLRFLLVSSGNCGNSRTLKLSLYAEGPRKKLCSLLLSKGLLIVPYAEGPK
jgi:hypothetical protein